MQIYKLWKLCYNNNCDKTLSQHPFWHSISAVIARRIYAVLTQLVEYAPFKRKAMGSNPIDCATCMKFSKTCTYDVLHKYTRRLRA